MSIFAEEWRACLCEQYKYVVRKNDARTLETLTGVMHDVGFTDDELNQLKIQATLRTEDVAEDFQPDLDILQESTVYPAAVVENPSGDDLAEAETLTVADQLEKEAEIEAAQVDIPLDDETDADADSPTEEDSSPPDEDAPMQLSLFG